MKLQFQIIILLHLFLLSAVPYCKKDVCKSSEHRLDASKSWLPLNGKTQLSFLDETGDLTNFNLEVVDTVETNVNPDCGATNIYESINAVLFLNRSPTDAIIFRLNPPNAFIMEGYSSNNFPTLRIKDVFKSASEGIVAKRLSNYIIGAKTYQEVMLVFQNPKTTNPIDSIFLANNVGIVGFKYSGKKYSLQ